MRAFRWQISLAVALVGLSVLAYLIHYAIFRDSHHIFIFMVHHIAFVPLEVLFVTLVIHQLLSHREKRHRLEKMNMVIGVFFGDIGTRLLAHLSDLDPRLDEIKNDLIVSGDWTEQQFAEVSRRLRKHDYQVEVDAARLEDMRTFLRSKRDFLVRLLENPSLLEHESFTDLLRSLFHLSEELQHRENMAQLPETDSQHLALDVRRAYGLLVHEWLGYMRHLRCNYPYLFSLAMRTNPFDESASVLVT